MIKNLKVNPSFFIIERRLIKEVKIKELELK
jgi:hypothetical protein